MEKYIYPYQMYSASVHGIRKAVDGIRVIKTKDSNYQHRPNRLIINWGSSSASLTSHQRNGPVLNPTSAVKLCANKERFFNTINGRATVPEFTNDPGQARTWAAEGVVVARATLNGHSGEGIIFSDEDPDFYNKAPFFTKYIPKLKEFRVHIWDGEILDTQQKKLRSEDENGNPVDKDNVNWRVRSYSNGFIFARNDLQVPRCVHEEALSAFRAIPNLTFGAFDVIWQKKNNQAYVLECNTAPGLEGTTLDRYAERINAL